jgi:hypothetical protein
LFFISIIFFIGGSLWCIFTLLHLGGGGAVG